MDEQYYSEENTTYGGGALEAINDSAKQSLPLDVQEKDIAALSSAIDKLSIRLKPVLVPDSPVDTVEKGSEQERPMSSPTVLRINSNSQSIRRITGRVRDILDRLEC